MLCLHLPPLQKQKVYLQLCVVKTVSVLKRIQIAINISVFMEIPYTDKTTKNVQAFKSRIPRQHLFFYRLKVKDSLIRYVPQRPCFSKSYCKQYVRLYKEVNFIFNGQSNQWKLLFIVAVNIISYVRIPYNVNMQVYTYKMLQQC